MRYAYINTATNIVDNVIELDPDSDWTPPAGFIVIQSDVVQMYWLYVDGVLVAPPVPPKTPEQILAENKSVQGNLLTQAALAMAPIVAMITIGDATDAETASAKEWQDYYRALRLVDVSVESPEWPIAPIH
ncbi:hypothetical protein A9978_19065 [Pseudomonas sp. UMC65]|uniref:tail fiber assembly protein n=1 Tax=Pseudomonas sp. UMC65 TaxID=1862323 RepID=UPI001600A7B6|nr:tail fiber assembly protein [Pseudomonas sp. UMC65]MBB1614541.1 hypothetical protein [Pseudomonas sp. UMC65]